MFFPLSMVEQDDNHSFRVTIPKTYEYVKIDKLMEALSRYHGSLSSHLCFLYFATLGFKSWMLAFLQEKT